MELIANGRYLLVGRSERAQKGVQGFPSHVKVQAEFVDEIPDYDLNDNFKGKKAMEWQPTPGVREALQRAYESPRRAMLLMEYVEGSPSKRRANATMRVTALKKQGYSEENGWVVRSVDAKVYVLYTGVTLD